MLVHRPRSALRPASRRRVVALLLLLIVCTAGWWGFRSLGALLYEEDPLANADVIFVLGGARVERIAEAGELYREGWAPRILISRQESERAETILRERGLAFPSEIELQTDVLVKMGVPPAAIGALDEAQSATANESRSLLELASTSRWRAAIVVTSKLHTARARMAFRRRFAGSGTAIIMRASRYDPALVDRWWTSRGTLRFALWEAQKMLVYWLGIAG